MTTIVTRTGKGVSLTWQEMDANLNNLNDDKLEAGFPASDVANTPAGNITSTDVQAAINELDGEITSAATELSTLVVKKTSPTGAAIVPTGTTGQRPGSPVEGHLRRNSELGQWEGYDGSNWTGIGGVISVNGQTGAVTITADVTSVAGKTGAVTLVKGDVDLGNVDNTADAAKSVAYATNSAQLGGVAAANYSQTSHTHSGYVSTDHRHNNVGSLCFAKRVAAMLPGSTYSGSQLYSSSNAGNNGSTLSGTWRCLGTTDDGGATLMQRIS